MWECSVIITEQNITHMKRILYRLSRWMLASMGLTAVVSCSKDIGFRAEYGSPYCTYDVKCRIVDSQTGSPVNGLELVPGTVVSTVDENGSYKDEFRPFSNPVTNGAQGVYHLKGMFEGWGKDYAKMYIKMNDSDTNAHGNYKDTVYIVPLQFAGEAEGTWYNGKYVGDVTLEATCSQSDKE